MPEKSIIDDPSTWENVKPDPFADGLRQALDGRLGSSKSRAKPDSNSWTPMDKEDYTGKSNGSHSGADYHLLRAGITDIIEFINSTRNPDGTLNSHNVETVQGYLARKMRSTPREGCVS